MCHVKKRASRVPLHAHVLRSSEASEGYESARLGNLSLILVVRSQICDATDGIALYLDIRGQHLTNEWFKAAKSDDEKFVIGCCALASVYQSGERHSLLTARLPRAAEEALCTSVSWLARR